MKPFIVSNDLLHEPSALRDRAARDGYLFIKGFVNQDDILETRRDMARILLEFGWIARAPTFSKPSPIVQQPSMATRSTSRYTNAFNCSSRFIRWLTIRRSWT